MKIKTIFLTAVVFTSLAGLAVAQQPTATPEISREKLEQAYAKLFEAQRYIWVLSRTRSQTVFNNSYKSAKLAIQKAIELNPNMAEAYTAMAELNVNVIPGNAEEAILYAGIASKLNPDNFGARQILARVYSEKSGINTPNFDAEIAERAILEWKEVSRLDSRNAEAWAFLSLFYEKLNKSSERIESLKNWMASTAPLSQSQYYYRKIFGKGEDLSPENARLKLGEAFLKSGRNNEAVEVLSQTVAAQPDNSFAIDFLRQAVQNSDGKSNQRTVEFLQQAAIANPKNLQLIELLTEIQQYQGKTGDAVKTLRNSIQNAAKSDKPIAANLQVSLGDLYQQMNQPAEAILAYEEALSSFGIGNELLNNDEQRVFAARVLEKIIGVYKSAGKIAEAKAKTERARTLFGRNDSFADKQVISILRDTGRKEEALRSVRAARKSFAGDYALLRTEATILTELGRVKEGVALVKTLINQKFQAPSAYYDDFSNYLFISGLFNQARKSKEAIESAQKAFSIAESSEQKQLANISLANAQHRAGNFRLAETTLRGILQQTPDNPIALNNLGFFLLERNDRISEGIELIRKALKIDPTNASYLDSLGWGYYKLGMFQKAEHYLKTALRYNSGSATIFEHLGDVYLKQGKPELAKSAWQRAISFSTDSEAKNRLKSKLAK